MAFLNVDCFSQVLSMSVKMSVILPQMCIRDRERPFNVRENARCQSFPDEWEFCGSVMSQYKQVGNAVPVNLAYEVARSIREALDKEKK